MNLYLAEIQYDLWPRPRATQIRLVRANTKDEAYEKANKYAATQIESLSNPDLMGKVSSITISECIE